jgi:hypothetical protein
MTASLPAVTSTSMASVGTSEGEPELTDPAPPRTPLEIMLDNMRYWDAAADRIAKQLDALIIRLDDATAVRQAADLVKDFVAAKNKSQACAEAAAPYYHGRLQSVSSPPELERPSAAADRALLYSDAVTQEEAAKAYLRLVGAPL